MKLEALRADYLRHIHLERNLSPNTVYQYGRDLQELTHYLETEGIPLETGKVTTARIRQFVQHLSSRGLSPASIKRKLSCLRSLFAFACNYHGLRTNPAAAVASPKVPHRLPEVLTGSEVARLMEACDTNHFGLYRARDRAIVATLAVLGVRRQELADIRLDDWDARERTLRIRSGKGDRERLLPLTDELISLGEQWLEVRPETDQPWFFLSRHGNQLAAGSLQRMFRRLSEAAGLNGRIHCHMFRHFAATSIVQNASGRGGVERARRILGHASLETLQVYAHLSVDDLRPAAQDIAAMSGITVRTGPSPGVVNVDPGTHLVAKRLQEMLDDLADDWQDRGELLRWLTIEWTRQLVPADIVSLPLAAVDAILTTRDTVQGLSLDDHIAVAHVGQAISRHLRSRGTHRVEDILDIGEELGPGLPGGEATGEGVSPADLRRIGDALPGPAEATDPLVIATSLASACSRLESLRTDIPCGRTAIELLVGLLAWNRGLPPLIVPAGERHLWRSLVSRVGSGDASVCVSWIIGRWLSTLADATRNTKDASQGRDHDSAAASPTS